LFFFNLHTADGVDRDEEGVELPDIETAYLEAFHTASEMWIEAIRHRRDATHHRFEITDARGCVLMTVPFTEITERGAVAGRRPTARAEARDQRQPEPRVAPRAPQQIPPQFEELTARAVHSRNLGLTVIEEIRVARRQLIESKALLAQLTPTGR
jgi:hypothetical protein